VGTEGALIQDNPQRLKRDLSLAQDRIAGKTYKELAQAYGITEGRISQILNDDQIKGIIEEGSRQMVSLVPKAIDNYRDILTNTKDDKVKLSASKDILQSTGIAATHTTSVIIQNSFNRQSVELTPEVLSLLQSRPPARQIIDCNLDLDGDGD